MLLFLCCHPALSPPAQIALTLRAVGGLTTREIARAFLVPEPTMARRITRAKQTVKASAAPFAMPRPEQRAERLAAVLHVLYLIFNEVQAAIAAVHDESTTAEATDWPQIKALYELMLRDNDNPVVRLNHAVALAMVDGPHAGLDQLAALDSDDRISDDHRLHADRAHLLEAAGDHSAARAAYLAAAERTTSLQQQRYLHTQAARLAHDHQPSKLQMAIDRSAAAVWVLVADGLRGSERARPLDHLDGSPTHRHVSLHANADGARHVLNRLLAGHLERGGQVEDVTVTPAERTVGDLAIGHTHHERGPQP